MNSALPAKMKVVVPPKSMGEYANYVQRSKEKYTLKQTLAEIQKTKEFVKEHIHVLESAGDKRKLEEEEVKEDINKLDLLKKKKISVMRKIDSLNHETEILRLITNDPNKTLGFGTDTTSWERKVITRVKELPASSPCFTILSKLSELQSASKLPPNIQWDRTETLSFMENMLVSMDKVLKDSKEDLKSMESELNHIKNNAGSFISKILADDDGGYLIPSVLEQIEQEYLESSLTITNELLNSKPPYTIEVENQRVHRLQRQINEKAKEIRDFLPLETDPIENDGICNVSSLELVPAELPVDKLLSSVSDEVNLFMSTKFTDCSEYKVKYENINFFCTSESQFQKLKENVDRHSKLISFEEEISSSLLQIQDMKFADYLKDEAEQKLNELNASLRLITGQLDKLNTNYQKLKKAFLFLRNEPLNQKLSGLIIEGEDISHWLARYITSSERLQMEEWLQTQSQSSNLLS